MIFLVFLTLEILFLIARIVAIENPPRRYRNEELQCGGQPVLFHKAFCGVFDLPAQLVSDFLRPFHLVSDILVVRADVFKEITSHFLDVTDLDSREVLVVQHIQQEYLMLDRKWGILRLLEDFNDPFAMPQAVERVLAQIGAELRK